MNVRKMLRREADSILKNKEVGNRNDATDILISIRFSDNHIHHILPQQNLTDAIVEDLLSYSRITLQGTPTPEEEETPEATDSGVPKEVLFHNRQAFGDILTMTAGVRDFKKTFPNARVGVASTAMHIWDHNPNIDHSFRTNDTRKVVKVGPGFLTNKSNLWNFHMTNAFRMDIQNKLNLKIVQGAMRPDIWMTEEEYKRPPLIDGAYWVFTYGGEPGWPVKQYHRWQEVIDILKDYVTIVQVGVKKHPYPVLDNVVDYVGKTEDRDTGIRDLFNIFLHAQGSLGLVSMHMHLSACFNNPCVVLAGAREPSWFTQYFGHQYICTNGTMECSETKSCWACKLEGCRNLVNSEFIQAGHHTKRIPKCVDIIDPEEIADGVFKYYRGGRLEYNKKIPNTFFDNIVKEKKVFSIPKPDDIDEALLKKYGFEWGGGCITDRDWLFMKDVVRENNVKNIVEFGVGLSSLLFASIVDNVVSFETQEGWIKKIKDMATEKNHIFHWDGENLAIDDFIEEGHKFDMAFVDGPAGSMNREWSTKLGSELADIVIVHDAGRQGEKKWQAKYLEPTYELVAKGGHRCHLWIKKEICEVERDKVQVEIEKDDRPSFRMVTTCRGYGGSERSSLHIMRMFLEKGYRVELIPTGNISGEYMKNIPKEVVKRAWLDITKPIDIMTFYTSDCIWNFHQPQYVEVMNNLQAKRKIMILNYQLGKAGQADWTLGWDKYMFLNSTKEKDFIKRVPGAVTKVLPPPTDLSEFLEVHVDYKAPLKLIRHNSQRDAKHPDYTNDLITQILEVNDATEFYYMPPYSKTFDHDNVHKFRVNEIPVPRFLSQGNCFWYHLPPGYQDQGPRVILEAMACGLPVIADNRDGAMDRVTPETGWLCEDVPDYLEVIEEITNDISILETKGKAARELAKREYVAERWREEIEN
jgi:ADP-heptose:LPS heptosyltransferase/glycosyltransferase involved in cell wall biosynthesis